MWFNYLLTQVHLLWSFLNVRASDLKCKPSFGLCNSPRLMRTANKGHLNPLLLSVCFSCTCFLLWRIFWVLCEQDLDTPWGSGVYACMSTHAHTLLPQSLSHCRLNTHTQPTEGILGVIPEGRGKWKEPGLASGDLYPSLSLAPTT